MGVPWCDYEFGPAEPLDGWEAPHGGGVYAVTFRKDRDDGPTVHVVVYFGESGDLAGRGIGPAHEKYECWARAAAGRTLYVSIHAEENGDRRRAKEQEMIDAWMPRCNR